MDTKTILTRLCQAPGLPGQTAALDTARQLLTPYGTVTQSPLGSLVCTVKEPQPGQPHILLDAHLDEIGLLVTTIGEDGFLRVGQFGGTDPRLLAASLVTVHTKGGDLPGVICSVPPHLAKEEDTKALPADKIYIDLGLSGEAAKAQVHLGDPITFQSTPHSLLNGRFSLKALDDRAGCVALLKALEHLGDTIPCGLTVLFSTMEEIGGMGAQTSAYTISPTHALAVDVSFGASPDSPPEKCGDLGKGPMIGFSPILDPQLSRQLETLATAQNIPYQTEVMGGKTGTNADSIATSRGGVRCALLSIPLRNMHMPVELLQLSDIDHTGQLIAAWIHHLAKGGSQ